MKILCVEDDEGLAARLEQALTQQHYQVELAADGLRGWNLAETETYDLILLDWMLPKLSGLEFCHRLRTVTHSVLNPNQDTPVLLMTAMDEVTDKVMGLNAGADDYVVKPFNFDELLARIRALMRRSQSARTPLLQWGELCLNPNSCEVTYQKQPLILATKEYELLELFLRNPDRIFSLDRLLSALWKVDEMPGEGAVRAQIKGLHQKLKQAGADDPLETIYKLGYRLRPQKLSQPGETGFFSPIPAELWEAWQEARPSYCDRLAIMQQAVVALQAQTLTARQQQQAIQEAHTLIGSLGSFGLEEASQLARQIQKIFKRSESLGQCDLEQLLPLMAALGRQLETSTNEKSAAIETLKLPSPASPPLPVLLIVDNDLPWIQELTAEALSWGLRTEVATAFTEAERLLQKGAIAAILLNLDGSEPSDKGLEFLATVRDRYPTLPAIALATAASFECKPVVARELLTRVRNRLEQRKRWEWLSECHSRGKEAIQSGRDRS